MSKEPSENSSGGKLLWAYGVHDCYASNEIAEKAGGFKGTGSLRKDITAVCKLCNVLPHPALVRSAAETAEGEAPPDVQTLAAQSVLFDVVSFEMLKVVMPTALHLQEIRFSGCRLDCEMLGLLRAGMTENSTIHTMYLDWNPVELPLDAAHLDELLAAEKIEDLDELERHRAKQQVERLLIGFREVLSLRAEQLLGPKPVVEQEERGKTPEGGPPPEAMAKLPLDGHLREVLNRVAVEGQPNFPYTAMLEPLDFGAWINAFQAGLCLPHRETDQIFELLDRSPYGPGDGYVPLVRLELALQQLPAEVPAGAEGAAEDPVGAAFAAFVNQSSILEVLSFRCCNIGRLEFESISKAMRTHRSLKALNLWGNRICDITCGLLAEALDASAPYYSVNYLGLGRNLITHRGLERLCSAVGARKIEDKTQGEALKKEIAAAVKEKEKYMKKPDPPRVDGKGRERYKADWNIDVCEEQADSAGTPVWIHVRNPVLKTLNLEDNPIEDASAVRRLQPNGLGELVLRGCPCVAALAEPPPVAEGGVPEEKVSWTGVPGWTLVIK